MSTCSFFNSKQFNFLKSLKPDEKVSFLENFSKQKFKKGDIIFFENEELQQIFCITEGFCKLSKENKKDEELITNLLGCGEVMGRRSVLTQKGALLTATAITDVTLCCIPKKLVLDTINSNNNFCQDILNGFIVDSEDDIKKIEFYKNNCKIKQRLAGLLIYTLEKFGVDTNGWLKVSLKRQDIANILGTTTEYIISILSSFKEKKYVSFKKGKMKLISTIALKELMTF